MTFRTKQQGLSLVELLISMAILGILLAVLGAFLVNNQKVTTSQITAATLENDTRLAFLRMSDIISQAQYIYPLSQTLKINGTDYTTGARTLAVLVPRGISYCTITSGTANYCGFAFTVESRTPFAGILGPDGGSSGLALVETKVVGLEWKQKDKPAQKASLNTWLVDDATTEYRFPITDSIDASKTNLMGSVQMAAYSDFDGFKLTPPDESNLADPLGDADDAEGLVAAVESTLYLRRVTSGQTLQVERSNFVFSRAIPRNTLPK